MRKKLLSWLLVLSMVLSMIPATVLPVRAAEPKGTDTGGVTLGESKQINVGTEPADIEITAGGTYELTGSSTERSVIVKTTAPVMLVLNNLTMERDKSPIQLQDGANVTLVLKAGTTNSITCNATMVTVTTTTPDPDWHPGPDETEENRPQITVSGNDGMTAGINVPENATLTIDKVKGEDAGELTVQGGYGGAGIGGGAATPEYTEEVGETGARGGDGANGSSRGSITQGGTGGAGGPGAAGGLFGKNAENAGTVVINAGALTVTGGKNAAGIGGGRGADGQTATARGTPGSNAYGGYYNPSVGSTAFSGGGGGSGGNGGNGGNGGTGGSLKALTITGGTVKVTGGEEATGIGGGNGGTGGDGGPGGAGGAGNGGGGTSFNFKGGRGGDGATGAVGFKGASPGGNGGTVTITGGRVEITGYVAVGAGRTLWPSRPTYNRNHNSGYNSGIKGGLSGGAGGYNNANKRPEPMPDNGSLTIQNANVKLDNTVPKDELKLEFPSQPENFSNGGNRDLTQPNNYVRPRNINNEDLYRVDVTVKRLDRATLVPNADFNITLHPGEAGNRTYTYATAADDKGVGSLWLPVSGQDEKDAKDGWHVSGTDVSHKSIGRILRSANYFPIKVEAHDGNTCEVYIGVEISTSSNPKDAHVYDDPETRQYENPVQLVIDGTTVPEDMDIVSIRWFREPITNNTDVYAAVGTVGATSGALPFMNGFKAVIDGKNSRPGNVSNVASTDPSDGAGNTISMDPETGTSKTRTWNLPITENGRYWVQLCYKAKTEGATVQDIVQLVEVKNIFRTYPIEVRGRFVTFDPAKPNEPIVRTWFYGGKDKWLPLKNNDGSSNTVPYGFPWDLDGYKQDNIPSGTMLKETDVAGGYDSVTFYHVIRYLNFYESRLGDGNINLATAGSNNIQSTPHTIKLNDEYFNTSTLPCETEDGVKQFNKYLITYSRREGALNVLFASGQTEDGKELWNQEYMYADDLKDIIVKAMDWPGYTVTSGLLRPNDGNPIEIVGDGYDAESMTYNLQNAKDYVDLTFTYKKTTTDVTVKAYYQTADGEEPKEIEGFVPYTVEAPYGKEYEPKPLALEGYKQVGSNLTNGKIMVKDPATIQQGEEANVVKFYFVKEKGNVTYRAVVKGAADDGSDDLVVWSKDRTVARDAAPETTVTAEGIPPELKNYVIKGENGNVSITRKDNNKPADTYDGVHELYVTYEYEQKKVPVTIKAINVLTNTEIPLPADQTSKTLATGETHTINAPTLVGYEIRGTGSVSYSLDADTKDPSVSFFYMPSEKAEVAVTLYYTTTGENGEQKQTIQVLRSKTEWDNTVTIQVPALQGYTMDWPQEDVNVKETEDADSGEKKYSVSLTPHREPKAEGGFDVTGNTAEIKYRKDQPITVHVKLTEQGVANSDLSGLLLAGGWTGVVTVEKNEDATATAPSIPNYKLVDSKTFKKTLTWDEIKAALDAKETPTITFTYEKAEADLITITVNGVTEGGEPLYTHTKDVRKSSTEVPLDIITINSYALKNVTTDEGEITPDTAGVYKINPKSASKTVTATYQDNMTTVTIHGYYKGSQDKVFPDIKVKAELGKRYEYPRPVITGYDNADDPNTNPGRLDSVTANAEITFYYVKAKGNVTYQAKAEGVVLASKTETVAPNAAIDKSDEKAAQVFAGGFPYFELKAGSGDATAVTYNGKDDVTVTYTYTRKQQKLTIVKKDVDGEAKIADPDQELTLPAGKLHTFGADEITGVTGYSAVAALNPKTHTMGDADEQVVFWYRKNVENRYATITVNSVCDENGDNVAEVFQSYQLPALKDVELSVNAPTWTGYKLKNPLNTKETFTPTGDQAITFEYVLDAPQSFTVELKDNSKPNTPLSAPADYQTRYTLKKGSSVTIQAPAINGYSLVGKSIVTVNYGDPLTDGKLVFNYAPVETANFVKHTVVFKNHDETIEFYRYSTLVSKSDTETTTYKASTVQNVIAGYKLKDIHMKVEGAASDTTDMTQVIAPNNKNVTIVYRFEEDTSRIVIKKVLSDKETVADTILSGYRTGLKEVEVTAPLVDGYALAADESLTKKITELASGDNVITFNYDKVGNVTFTLKEHNDATGQDETIVVRNGVLNNNYNPSEPNNPLNLSSDKYTFVPSESATPPFNKAGGKVTVTDTSTPVNYDVYYTKGTRAVQFVAIDSAVYPQPADMAKFDPAKAEADGAILDRRNLTEHARVGEMYKASAQSVDRYALDDQITKYYPVEDSTETLCVYFWYRAKKAGTVTVHYHTGLTADNHDKAALLMSYSLDAVVGEKVIIKLPEYLMDGKYKLPAGEAKERTKVVAEGDNNVVDINYDPNFVTVNVKTKRSDFNDAAEYESREVILTDTQGNSTGNLTLTPPYRAGYTLVGIDGVTGGGVNQFPATYQDGKLTLRGLTSNMTITYYYSKTSATEYQSDVTVQYKYGKYDLEPQKVQSFNRDVESSVSIPVFDGYVAKQYQFTDGADAGAKQDIAGAVNIRPTAEKGELVIFYARKDNSAVVPGNDEKIPSPDDVVIKPNGTNIPTVDEVTGNVTVPDGGEVVVPGVGVIVPPNGSIVKPDGTIVAPGTDPGVKIDPAKPGGTTGYISVTYHANGGEGESYTQMAKEGQSITLIAVADRFKKSGFKGTGWNANDKGLGVSYAAKSITDKSLVL